MSTQILALIGGIGLFLFGMLILTDALRQLATARMRSVLTRFTRSPLSGTLAGAFTTVIIQSSSATMITAISFVGASLMTFPQSIGVDYGANIGTTMTGWIVALLGLKLNLGLVALPMLLLASLMRASGRGRIAQVGLVPAGFSLVFIGLGMMQDGAAAFQGLVTPESFPTDTWPGRLRLVLLGVAITVVIQSSSAGVAMALVLLSAGSLTLAQGAALVIGMDVGTAATALLATAGGSRAMRQAAVAHVVYNVVTGTVAFLLLDIVTSMLGGVFAAKDPVALVTFHSLFNIMGAVLMLPVTRPFARLILWLIPASDDSLTDTLDRRLLADPLAALTAAQTSAAAIARRIFLALAAGLREDTETRHLAMLVPDVPLALSELEGFLSAISTDAQQDNQTAAYSALLHETDHLRRLFRRSQTQGVIPTLLADRPLRRPVWLFAALLERAARDGTGPAALRLARLERSVARRVARQRRALLLGEHAGLYSLQEVFTHTDVLRWLGRSLHHAAQIAAYDGQIRAALAERPPKPASAPVLGPATGGPAALASVSMPDVPS
jgi:phosphate:Na+ symporter